ncbi:hypothetical protein BHE74_00035061 [Ensete ventricosum]|nr:hypothetical protein BHE74_00035061 [Ensete ventricosum]
MSQSAQKYDARVWRTTTFMAHDGSSTGASSDQFHLGCRRSFGASASRCLIDPCDRLQGVPWRGSSGDVWR